jgi:hypothetical protein
VATTIAFIFGSLVIYAILARDYDISLEMKNIVKCLIVSILASGLGFGVFFSLDLLAVPTGGLVGLVYLAVKLLIALVVSGFVYLYLLKLVNIFSAEELKVFEKLAGEYRIIRPIIGIIK